MATTRDPSAVPTISEAPALAGEGENASAATVAATGAGAPATPSSLTPRVGAEVQVSAVVRVRGAREARVAQLVVNQVQQLVGAGARSVLVEVDPDGQPVAFGFLRELATLRAELAAAEVTMSVTRAPTSPPPPATTTGEAGGGMEITDVISDVPEAGLDDLFAVHQLLQPTSPPRRATPAT